MYRHLLRIPLRSIADSFCKPKPREHGWRSVSGKLELSRTLITSIDAGNEHFEYGAKSMSRSMKMQMQVVNALRMGERQRASNLLLDLGHGTLQAHDFVHIFDYCANSPDPLFVLETCRIMEEREIGLNNKCYLLMMRALCKGGYLDEALNLMNFLGESHGIHAILPVYNCFLRACAKMQSIMHANQCLDLMERWMVGKNEITYSELLKLAVWQQNLSAAHEIWNDYIKHYSLSIISLRKFIWSFTRLRDLKSAHEALQHMVALAIRGSIFINRTAEGMLYSSRLDIPIRSNSELSLKKFGLEDNEHSILSIDCKKINSNASNIEQWTASGMVNREVDSLGLSMRKKYKNLPVMKFLRWSFNDVIHACAQSQNCWLAEQLLRQMENIGLQPSSHTYDRFVKAVVSEKGFSHGMEVLNIMRRKNLKPYDSTLATLSVECSKLLELDLAEIFLEQISEMPYSYPYNAFLAACDTMDQPERAVRMLAKMRQLKLQPDIRTYELLFSLFGNVNAPYEDGNMLSQVDAAKRINAIETDMENNGVQHSYLSMKNLLKALGAEGMIRELIKYLHVADNNFYRSNIYLGTPIYNNVLHSLVKAKASHTAIEIFKNMKACGLPPDTTTYNIMIDCCSIIKCFRSALVLVSMMVREGFYPQVLTYTALIKVLLEYEDFKEAIRLLDQASSEGGHLDVLLFNTILRKACEKGRIDVIELIVGQMHEEKIQPDPSTCYFVFSAYVDSGFHNTAMEALQVLSMRMICEDTSTLLERRIILEGDFILAEDFEADSRILQLFKGSEENLAVALLNLRWCATLGLSISWSPDQSLWAKRLRTSYGARKGAAR